MISVRRFEVSKSPSIVLVVLIAIFLFVFLVFNQFTYTSKLHADKYGTNIPPIEHILRTGEYFSNVNASRISLFSQDRTGYVSEYSTFPYYNLVLVPILTGLPFLSTKTAVFSLGILNGAIILGCWFEVLRKYFGLKVSTIFGFLLAVNPLFQLFAVLTIDDLPAFTFLSIGLLAITQNKQNLAYFMFGLAMLIKISFAPIILGIGLAWIYFYLKPDWKRNVFSFFALAGLPYILFLLLVQDIPQVSELEALLRVMLFIGVNAVGYGVVSTKLFEKLAETRFYVIVLIASIFSFPIVLLELNSFLSRFISEPDILLSLNLYVGTITHLVEAIPAIFLILILVAGFYSDKFKHPLLVALYSGGGAYFLLGAKAIYFHYYYKHIFLFICLIAIAIGLIEVMKLLPKVQARAVLSIFVVTTLIFSIGQYPDFISRNNNEAQFVALSEYLKSNLEEGEIVIRSDSQSKNIIVFESIPVINYSSLSNKTLDDFRSLISEEGLHEALVDRNVKFLISASGKEDFSNFNYLLDESINAPTDRSDLIAGDNERVGLQSLDHTEKYFELTETFGTLYVYRLKSIGEL